MSCENCFKGSELPGEPQGSLVDGAYFRAAAAPTAEGEPKRAIVLLSDIFGLPLKNCKIMADQLSERVGVDVWVPDLFDGRPPVKPEEIEPLMPDRAHAKQGFMSYIRLLFLFITHFFAMRRTRPAIGEARAREFIEKLRTEKSYNRLGAVGYCYGGTVAVGLGKSPQLVNTLVIAHPGWIKIEDVKLMKVPSSWVCAEEDFSFKPHLRNGAEAVYKEREGKDDFVPYEFKDWKGTAHGFAIRPNQSVPDVKAGYEGALAQTVDWFGKTLF
ncbi:dienelactone hydrolase endo-1-3,1,4-beta-D-glucanase [Peniophora sp. CONT]|nr:dienelactone hydrolase endo-1-3,1,4-beta-D-glucanase [Peniophora sp. CONT]